MRLREGGGGGGGGGTLCSLEFGSKVLQHGFRVRVFLCAGSNS